VNIVLTFLEENRKRLDLDRYSAGRRLSTLMVTPRFHASRHVVFLVFAGSRDEPILVAKLPRIGSGRRGIECEAANLRSAEMLLPKGSGSIPRVLACEPFRGHPLLVETALDGRPMGPAKVRRHLVRCCRTMIDWLTAMRVPDDLPADHDAGWFQRLIDRPLHGFEKAFPVSAEEARSLEETRRVVWALDAANLPPVFEHGDLSHPNVMVLRDGKAGVIDWELAEPRGLPATDLFFFLTYAAFAVEKAATGVEYVRAFHAAFFERSAWARPYVSAYARRLQLPPETLTPLFVACWARRVAGLLTRPDETEDFPARVGRDTAQWLRANRYYLLWRHTLLHLHELRWNACASTGTRGP